MNSRSYRVLTASLIYLVAIAGALTIATLRSRAKAKSETTPAPSTQETERPPATKPFFSLSTHRTYGTSDNPRLWVDYQGVDHLDFRVYQVKEPRKFFTQLKDPHQMGKQEEEEVANTLPHRKSFLERVRTFKRWAYTGIKAFVRGQLQRDSRQAFNQKFRKEAEVVRTPLNVSDYARVPLLNPDLLVTNWREPLPRQVRQALVQQLVTVAGGDDDAEGHTRLPAACILPSHASRMYPPNHRTRRAAANPAGGSPPSAHRIAR